MTFIYQGSFHIICYATHMTNNTCRPTLLKSTVIVHHIDLAAYGLLDTGCTQSTKLVFPEVAQNSLKIPCSEKFLTIPGFWPPCFIYIFLQWTIHFTYQAWKNSCRNPDKACLPAWSTYQHDRRIHTWTTWMNLCIGKSCFEVQSRLWLWPACLQS